MGCCFKKQGLSILNDQLSQFYFRAIKLEFIIKKIKEFNNSTKNYNEFWNLTKLIGIHPDYKFQIDFWESAYVEYSDQSIDGILFVFLLLCKGDNLNKLEYIKYYLSSNINLAKENDNNLIMNRFKFQNIMYTYFSCLSFIPHNILKKEKKDLIQSNFGDQKYIQKYTEKILNEYVKKNFYVNAGAFLEEKIFLLVDDSKIRKSILEFYKNDLSKTKHDENKNVLESNNEERPLTLNNNGRLDSENSRFSPNKNKKA
jgi:hypothetical protein